MAISTESGGTSRFVVGVDFGTTFTSVSLTHSTSPTEIKLVQCWPNQRANETADYVPSEIRYRNCDQPQGERDYVWGQSILPKDKNSSKCLKWFKLLLQDGSTEDKAVLRISDPSSIAEDLSQLNIGSSSAKVPSVEAAAQMARLGLEPVAVVADFLKVVREVTMKVINETYSPEFVKLSKVYTILTIPAIWKDAARASMVRAAEQAGYGKHRQDFDLVTEPEAGAAHTLKVIQPHKFARGDSFIICDAGGGTVDLIAYKIAELEPLRVNETVCGSGGLHGAVYLDQRFNEYVQKLLGDRLFGKLKENPRVYTALLRSWEEEVKYRFGDTDSSELEYDVQMPMGVGIPEEDEERRISFGFHTMTKDDVKSIFDPVVDKIVDLVKGQVQGVERQGQKVAAVILIGGFGSSPYLSNVLRNTDFNGKRLAIIQPINARTAIARGALLRGLDGSVVVSKRARRYYGVDACAPLVLYQDLEGVQSHVFWHPSELVFLVKNKVSWYTQKGQVLKEDTSVNFSFYRAMDVSTFSPRLARFEDEILACDSDSAPEFEWQSTPRDVYKVCTLHSDLSSIHPSRYETITNKTGGKYYRISYQVRMSMVGEMLKFQVFFRGKCYGDAVTKF